MRIDPRNALPDRGGSTNQISDDLQKYAPKWPTRVDTLTRLIHRVAKSMENCTTGVVPDSLQFFKPGEGMAK